MKTIKELKSELALTRKNKVYHQKQMEYFEQEEIIILSEIKECSRK